jgi:hypothetical protein
MLGIITTIHTACGAEVERKGVVVGGDGDDKEQGQWRID